MSLDFCRWEHASLMFFAYTFVCAWLLRGLTRRARMNTALGCVAGVAVVFGSAALPSLEPVWRFLLLPALVLLIGYWTSGLLFRAPSARVETFLAAVDASLRIRETSHVAPRPVAEVLEFAYAFVYALIPIALGIHLTVAPLAGIDVDRFWTVVLVTDFICFGMLPWIQSRPPRAIETGDPWQSSFRAFNLRMLGATSIHVNTCPSGHAAEALAAALLVSAAPAPMVAAMMLAAAAVSAGAVYGRYHYAIDVLSGWVVALAVWAVAARLTLT
jgi:membrane-associated phospholipid phosphatase